MSLADGLTHLLQRIALVLIQRAHPVDGFYFALKEGTLHVTLAAFCGFDIVDDRAIRAALRRSLCCPMNGCSLWAVELQAIHKTLSQFFIVGCVDGWVDCGW